jgi:hypothetical protein
MKPLFPILLALLLPAAGRAADEPAGNALSPREIADGWIQLFDGESTFGWTVPGNSKWTVVDGMLAPEGKGPATLVTTTEFSEFELKVSYTALPDTKAQVLLWTGPQGPAEGWTSRAIDLRGEKGRWSELAVTAADTLFSQRIRTTGLGFSSGTASSGRLQGGPHRGHIALTGSGVVFRSVKLRPFGEKPLFNGKDLSGWKEFPGRKSKFTVTPEGWLNVKDGPGDLQTEGQWADFVLQLDCISNGRRLNSGVFFRCRPGEYQQGYEAQVHNGFTDMQEKEYTIEEYDPQTHELKGKTKVKSAAIDYGTGAIYRRVPARRAVSKDGEWFTMTVVAHGRHIATWVNGVQQVDWTDNRPPKDNGRNGCRLEKGPISLQGHDPTTDLSFRNLRLAELPKKD